MAAIPSTIPRNIPKAATSRPSWRLIPTIGLSILLGGVWIAAGVRMLPGTFQNHDFAATYTVARMASTGEYARLQDPAVFQRFLKRTDPQAVAAPVLRPQFYALLLSPLTQLSYRNALAVWVGVQAACLLGCWIWAAQRFGRMALLWAALSAPCALALFRGQDSIFMLAIAVAGYALAKKKAYWSAGAVLALGLIQFQLVLFLAPAMLLGRRWKMFGGFAAMAAGLTAWCATLGGVQGLQTFAALLRNQDLSIRPDGPLSLPALIASLGAGSGIRQIVVALAVMAAAATVLRERQPLWRWMSLAITASLFAAPQAFGLDAVIMLLPIWLVLAYSRKTSTRIAFIIFATPVPFLAGLAASPWTLFTPLCLGACFGSLTWELWSSRRSLLVRGEMEDFAGDLTLTEPVL